MYMTMTSLKARTIIFLLSFFFFLTCLPGPSPATEIMPGIVYFLVIMIATPCTCILISYQHRAFCSSLGKYFCYFRG